jgi:TonB family protein
MAVEYKVSFSRKHISIQEADSRPRMKKTLPPVFPKQWSKLGVSGSAVVAFIVDEEGRPVEVQAKSATDEAFARSAEAAVSGWLFIPAKKGGQGIACRVEQVIDFNLKK